VSRGWIGVDLDGTLAKYDGWKGPLEIGEPIMPMVERVKAWLAEGLEVRIFTARVSRTPMTSATIRQVMQKSGLSPLEAADWIETWNDSVEKIRATIEDWCEEWIGRRLPVTNEKDFGMIELWDDRAVGVALNLGVRA
jgi:hypothetical protein